MMICSSPDSDVMRTVTCWSHVDVVVVTIHVPHVLATPVLVTHHCELSCVPRRILQFGVRRSSALCVPFRKIELDFGGSRS